MKIKRFVAPDMRQAMREVREEQGPEAVILSTRRFEGGIEIIAAIDYDAGLIREAARHGAPAPPAEVAAAVFATERVAEHTAPAAPTVASTLPERVALAMLMPPPLAAVPTPPWPVANEASVNPLIERAAQETVNMRAELGSLRHMLEVQLSSLSWNDMERRQPLRARVLREMTRLGIDADVARKLVDELPDEINADQARYLPLGMLSRSLRIGGPGASDAPGITALVGPTGVGKTTTIAKLAARAVLRRGAQHVALISTDHYRIGASAQLEHYGRLLGVQVFPAHDAESLRTVLDALRGRYTVFIDTAGVAGSDPRLTQQMDVFANAGELRTCLVLAANAQSQALDESIRAYLPLKLEACILTKLDEAPNLGGALSALIRHHLPLDYIADGQRVPEDLAVADARVLVCRAAKAQRNDTPDDSLMAERFGFAAVHA